MATLKKTQQLAKSVFAQWLKIDPFVKLIAKDDDTIRWQAMRNLLGKEAAVKYFGPIKLTKKQKSSLSSVSPHHVLQQEFLFLKDPAKRNQIINLLRFWATNPYLNANNINSHLTRQQVILSLLGPLFLNANKSQEKLIISAVKEIASRKISSYNSQGELSPDVHQAILTKVIEILQAHCLIKRRKQQSLEEQQFHIKIIREISHLQDEKQPVPFYHPKFKKDFVTLENKYPLDQPLVDDLIKLLEFYCFCIWPEMRRQAKDFYQHQFHRLP